MRSLLRRAAYLAVLLTLASGSALAQGRLGAPVALPNPHTAGPLTLRYDAATVEAPALEVFDLLGRRVSPSSSLAAGAYFYRLRYADGRVSAAGRLTKLTRGPLDVRLVADAPVAAPAPPAHVGGGGECVGSPESVLYDGLYHTPFGGATLTPVVDAGALEVSKPPGPVPFGWTTCLDGRQGFMKIFGDDDLPLLLLDGPDNQELRLTATATFSDMSSSDMSSFALSSSVSLATGVPQADLRFASSDSTATEMEVYVMNDGAVVLQTIVPLGAPVQLTSGSGGGSGKVSIQDFHFMVRCDRDSPLLESCDGPLPDGSTGGGPLTASLSIGNIGSSGQDGVVVTLGSETVVGDRLVVSPAIPSLTLNFTKITYTIVTGAGPGGGPHVRLTGAGVRELDQWAYLSGALNPSSRFLRRLDKATPLLYRMVCITSPCGPGTLAFGAPRPGAGLTNELVDVWSGDESRKVRMAVGDINGDGYLIDRVRDGLQFEVDVLEDDGSGVVTEQTFSTRIFSPRAGTTALFQTSTSAGGGGFSSYDLVYFRDGQELFRRTMQTGQVITVQRPVEVLSWSWGVSNQGSASCGSGGAGRCGAVLDVSVFGGEEQLHLLPAVQKVREAAQHRVSALTAFAVTDVCGPCTSSLSARRSAGPPDVDAAALARLFEVVDASEVEDAFEVAQE